MLTRKPRVVKQQLQQDGSADRRSSGRHEFEVADDIYMRYRPPWRQVAPSASIPASNPAVALRQKAPAGCARAALSLMDEEGQSMNRRCAGPSARHLPHDARDPGTVPVRHRDLDPATRA